MVLTQITCLGESIVPPREYDPLSRSPGDDDSDSGADEYETPSAQPAVSSPPLASRCSGQSEGQQDLTRERDLLMERVVGAIPSAVVFFLVPRRAIMASFCRRAESSRDREGGSRARHSALDATTYAYLA